MLILADNDVSGQVSALRQVIEGPDWAQFAKSLDLRFLDFAELGLQRDASDRIVWLAAQHAGAVLLTANRASGVDSLDDTIRQLSDPTSLPVLTIADPQRLMRDKI